jgi:hypothetical protein
MPFTIFLAICVVGSDLLIFVLCHRVFGEKYRARARRVAARRGAAKVRISTPPIWFGSQTRTATINQEVIEF